ncbi:BAQ_1a_G0044320.mRNA.1.CDS.1 [Saccharomyces cerevisiae]|nr:BAQ_1a_G0044320.mRNA.1.CDS.1 [Saccharomyces cerevisiae]CAI4735549.1 BAM_G0044310.mRNA.1.CDS.1 [Saccharomyces cerevisiae]CAI7293463.1 BAM_G0044310.mRNA.1.CDS.1 [Saccharomyces cerevisiae]CAI7295332.1 BAQ_1a_G0044320.mRNA.1.CDS.1 [Saccharomyces cerevisiae]
MSVHGRDPKKRQLRLISVAFKEASIDSPSFRASVNFFQTRVDALEDWIEKTVDFFDQKYKVSFEDFRRAKETLLSQLLPPPALLSNGFVSNQSFTPRLIDSFNKDYYDFSMKLLQIVKGDDSSHSTALLELMTTAIEPYRNVRKNFDSYQGKYDSMLASYQAIRISKTSLEPSSIKSDALQLFEVQKNYLKASLDLISAISAVKLSLDKFILESMKVLKSRSIFITKDSGRKIDLSPCINEYLDNYAIWVENSIEGSKVLDSDISNAKKQAYRYTLKRITPSSDTSDYNIRSIHSSKLLSKDTQVPPKSPEKSGWLYMKTQVGKPTREIWVRRWCFLKNAVFGMFLLSPSKTYVEETDKFGVFLTNVRYDPEEDRKFCFEVKIFGNKVTEAHDNMSKDITLVFQTSNYLDLKSWLIAFEATKKYVMSIQHDSLEYELAFKRFSPKFFEFASSTTTSIDQLITTFDKETESLYETLNCSISEYDILTLGEEKVFQFQMPTTPISTKMTQLAILSNFLTKGSWFPNAVLANIWGTTDWSEYTILPGKGKKPSSLLTIDGKRLPIRNSTIYPQYYSNELKVLDLQFKSLVFSPDQRLEKLPEELLLFKFEAFWCPNKKQKFSATCFCTKDYIYCYMNSMEFICLTKISLSEIVSVEADRSSKKTLKLYDASGLQMKAIVLFSDYKLIASKLQYLLENKAIKNPNSNEEILVKFEQMEKEFQEKKQEELYKIEQENSFDRKATSISKIIKSRVTFWEMSDDASTLLNRLKKLQTEYSITYNHEYEISSKGLAHILFGDKSNAFPKCLFLARKDGEEHGKHFWYKNKDINGKSQLVRKIPFRLDMTGNFLNTGKYHRDKESKMIFATQRIVKIVDNKYYEVDLDPFFVKVPFCHLLKLSIKFVITESYDVDNHLEIKLNMTASSSSLHVLYKLEYIDSRTGKTIEKLSLAEIICQTWALKFAHSEFLLIRRVLRYYLEKIGKHGKVIKAIKLCGILGVLSNKSEEPATEKNGNSKESESTQYDIRYSCTILFLVFIKLMVYRVTNLTFVFFRILIGILLLCAEKFSRINRMMVVGLLASIMINILLSEKASVPYWSIKRAEKLFHDRLGSDKFTMQRAIYISDSDLLSSQLSVPSNNPIFEKFSEDNFNKDYQYSETRKQLAMRRNELLIELRILQDMEKQLVHDDYEKFLLEEVNKCSMVSIEMTDLWFNDTQLQNYCSICNEELEKLRPPIT